MFDYVSASLEDVADHVWKERPQNVTSVRKYHLQQGNLEVVDKIDKARIMVRQLKLIEEFHQLDAKLKGE